MKTQQHILLFKEPCQCVSTCKQQLVWFFKAVLENLSSCGVNYNNRSDFKSETPERYKCVSCRRNGLSLTYSFVSLHKNNPISPLALDY